MVSAKIYLILPTVMIIIVHISSEISLLHWLLEDQMTLKIKFRLSFEYIFLYIQIENSYF